MMNRLLLLALPLFPTLAHADVDPKVNAAFIQAKNAEHNFECCYDRALETYKVKAKKCVDAIDAALAGGASADDQVGSSKKTVTEARAFCAGGVKRVSTIFIAGRLQYFSTWPTAIKKPGRGIDDGKQALFEANTCRKQVDDALAAGVSPSAQIKLTAETLTLAEAKTKVCDAVAAAGQGVVDAEQARIEAKKAPYRKVLVGEKLNLLENLWGDAFTGVGGTALDTPEKLASAQVWFTLLTWTDDLDRMHWTLRRYAFSGNHAAGSPTERSGCCSDPGSGEYR